MATRMIGAEEVAEQIGSSKAYAYKLIRRLNEELEASGRLTIPGKVNAEFFEERVFSMPEDEGEGERGCR